MPERLLVAREFGKLLGAIAHPRRIQIIEELRSGEKDVGTMQRVLGITHSNVSQHLAVLRAHRVVSEYRKGRQVVYSLTSPQLAEWLVEGMKLLPAVAREFDRMRSALIIATGARDPSKNSKQNQR